MNVPEIRRAEIWMNGGKGASSEAIWRQMMGVFGQYANHPVDSSDFGRCYYLLELIPEWKPRLKEMRNKSIEWLHLIDEWKVLTNLYESGAIDELNALIRRLVSPK